MDLARGDEVHIRHGEAKIDPVAQRDSFETSRSKLEGRMKVEFEAFMARDGDRKLRSGDLEMLKKLVEDGRQL